MRLWMKVSILSAALCIAALGTCAAAILDRTARSEMDREIAGALSEHYTFCVSLKSAAASSDEAVLTDVTRRSMVKYFFNNYAQFYVAGGDFFSLTQDGSYLYNLSPWDPASALPTSSSNARTHVIRAVAGKDVLIVEGGVKLAEGSYTVYLSRDISQAYEGAASLARTTSLICAAFSLLLALALTALIRLAMRPLTRLNAAARRIAEGSYGQRAPEGGADEVGDVSRSFNRMAGAVQEHIGRLEHTAERQKLLLASLTHELKTPMTSIIGYSEALRAARLNPQQRERALEHIHNESLRVERLSQKMMGLLSLESGEKPELAPVSAQALLERAAEALRPQLEARRQALAVQNDEFRVAADGDLMVSLLVNLIDNASKASPSGAVIRLDARLGGGGERVLEVKDEGRGIPKKDIARVTEPFYRVDKARSRSQGGAGLGLALCRAIAEAHGARVGIESEEGRGTSVRVVFPPEGGDRDEQKE